MRFAFVFVFLFLLYIQNNKLFCTLYCIADFEKGVSPSWRCGYPVAGIFGCDRLGGMEPLSLDQLLASVPPHLLDQKITNDIHLEDIARSLGNWRAAVVYLGLNEADEEEIEEENSRTDARRLVLCAAISQIVCACTNTYTSMDS